MRSSTAPVPAPRKVRQEPRPAPPTSPSSRTRLATARTPAPRRVRQKARATDVARGNDRADAPGLSGISLFTDSPGSSGITDYCTDAPDPSGIQFAFSANDAPDTPGIAYGTHHHLIRDLSRTGFGSRA
ncbi:hypothetical protein AAVH_16218 [Aphelenchoides avenae]|nr:hypothetical protein AAVH_16218 [Aphelenchus avenae]